MSELCAHSLIHIRDLLRAGDVSAVDVVSACLERIERTEPALHALLHVDAETALARARALDAQ